MFEENEMRRFQEHNFMVARFIVRGFARKKKDEGGL